MAEENKPSPRESSLLRELEAAARSIADLSKRLEQEQARSERLAKDLAAEKKLREDVSASYAVNQGDKLREQSELLQKLLAHPKIKGTPAEAAIRAALDSL